jgi:cysteine desulfurase
MTEVYLDWNAATPPHPDVRQAMADAAAEGWGNPASVHGAGRRARALVEDARETVGSALGVDARDVIFTSGGTEANNLALRGAKALVTSRLEHPSVVRVAEHLEAGGVPVRWLPVPPSGRIEPGDVERALSEMEPGAVVALMAVNHETGVIQPVSEVAALVSARGGHLHVDAVQAVGRLELDALAGAHSLAVTAHKVRGPKGIGALAFRAGRAPRPLLLGGAQERGLRPGTVDAVAAAGFRAAVQRLGESRRRYEALAPLRDELERALSARALVNGGDAPRAPHVSNLSFTGQRGDELVAALDLQGVRVSSGSACSAGTTEPSTVISAMLGRERASGAVRVSLGEDSDREQLEYAIAAFVRVLGAAAGQPLQ